MHFVEEGLEEFLFDLWIFVDFLEDKTHEFLVMNKIGLSQGLPQIRLHFSKREFQSTSQIFWIRASWHLSSVHIRCHHFFHILLARHRHRSFILYDYRIILYLKSIWATKTRGKVPCCNILHFCDHLGTLLSLSDDVLFKALITIKQKFKLVFVFVFAETDAKNDIQVVDGEFLSIITEFVYESFWFFTVLFDGGA
jgi:hypothetical protein